MPQDCKNQCFSNIETQLSKSTETHEVESVRFQGWTAFMNMETGVTTEHRSMTVEVESRKILKNGELSKNTKVHKRVVLLSFCPMCGERME